MGHVCTSFCDLCKEKGVYLSTTISWSQIGQATPSRICPPCAGRLLEWWKKTETITPEEIEKKKQEEGLIRTQRESREKEKVASSLAHRLSQKHSLEDLQSLLDKENQ